MKGSLISACEQRNGSLLVLQKRIQHLFYTFITNKRKVTSFDWVVSKNEEKSFVQNRFINNNYVNTFHEP